MTGRNPGTAEAVLQRLLVVLPEAARDEGARVRALAEALGVEPRRLLSDMKEVQARSYYLPSGLGSQLQITLTRDEISVWTTGEFQRPVRLLPREALALELALRVLARRTPGPDETDWEELRRRLVERIRTRATPDTSPAVALSGVEADGDPIRRTVEEAVRSGRALRLLYRVPGREPSRREVGPVVLVHAEGRWYLLARELEGQGRPKAFRLDRTLEAESLEVSFRPDVEDREAAEGFFRHGRVLDPDGAHDHDAFEAVVEYSPRIARWIRERGWPGLEEGPGGAVLVRHEVRSAEWLVRHVLGYGAHARILSPPKARERLVARVAAMRRGTGGGT